MVVIKDYNRKRRNCKKCGKKCVGYRCLDCFRGKKWCLKRDKKMREKENGSR